MRVVAVTLFILVAMTCYGQYDKSAYIFRRMVKNDRSLWSPDLKNKNGKARIPVRIERDRVYFSNENGSPAIGHLSLDDFLDTSVAYMKKLTDFELHITYENLSDYNRYFPKDITVRMTHQPFKEDKKVSMSHRLLRLKKGDKLEVSKIDEEGVIYFTNKAMKAKGMYQVPLDAYYTDLLYNVRKEIRRIINEASAEYLHPLTLKDYQNHTLTVYEVNKDLTEQKASLNSHTGTINSFVRHSKKPIGGMQSVFPLPIEIKPSDWEGHTDKVLFKSNFHFMTQTHSILPNSPMEDIYIMKFSGDRWLKTGMGWIEKPIPHDWENFVDFTNDWEIIGYSSNVKGKFLEKSGNVLHFLAKGVVESPEIEVRLKRVSPQKNISTTKGPQKPSSIGPLEKISKVTTLQDLDHGFIRSYHTNDSQIPFQIWDGKKEDGDIISIILNGSPIYERIGVVNKKKNIQINLNKGENIVEIVAENEGEFTPNTAMFQYGGDVLELQSKTGQSKKMKIFFE